MKTPANDKESLKRFELAALIKFYQNMLYGIRNNEEVKEIGIDKIKSKLLEDNKYFNIVINNIDYLNKFITSVSELEKTFKEIEKDEMLSKINVNTKGDFRHIIEFYENITHDMIIYFSPMEMDVIKFDSSEYKDDMKFGNSKKGEVENFIRKISIFNILTKFNNVIPDSCSSEDRLKIIHELHLKILKMVSESLDEMENKFGLSELQKPKKINKLYRGGEASEGYLEDNLSDELIQDLLKHLDERKN